MDSLEQQIKELRMDFTKLQAAVTSLSADVQAFIADVLAGNTPAQATIDAVTASLASLDAAVHTAANAEGYFS